MEEITISQLTSSLIFMVTLALGALMFSLLLTPIYTYVAYRNRLWKRERNTSTTGEALTIKNMLHAEKHNRRFPTMAGIIVVLVVTIITLLFNLDREQTWLPLAALVGGAIVGLIDDIINIRGKQLGVAGMRTGLKFFMITTVASIGAWFFYAKLNYTAVHIPFMGQFEIGWLIVPLFILAVVSASNAVNISDGLDGLAGGLLAAAFTAYAIIALLRGDVGIAAFCFTILGTLITYLWFNVHPARFMMGDVGSFALGTALGVVAMLTDAIFLLPIIGILLVVEITSSALQITSKKLFKRKIFISAPIHHHLEAKGWPESKVTMRFWLIANVAGFVGLLVALAGGHI